MGTFVNTQAFFSILRWRSDPTRDEARNVAVLLVDENGSMGGVRAAPLSTVSKVLHEQGLLDATLVALEDRFRHEVKPKLSDLQEMRQQLQRSLYLTEPRSVAVSDLDATLAALYRAYAAPRQGRSTSATKGHLLDQTVASLRKRGWAVRRGEYLGDFIFDVVADAPDKLVIDVLSFASGASNLVPVERDAGHFLYGIRRLSVQGLAVVQEPPDDATPKAVESFHRVRGWLLDENVRVVKPADIEWRPNQQTLLI